MQIVEAFVNCLLIVILDCNFWHILKFTSVDILGLYKNTKAPWQTTSFTKKKKKKSPFIF